MIIDPFGFAYLISYLTPYGVWWALTNIPGFHLFL